MKEEYVFPEKWQIKITKENFDIISKYYSIVDPCYKDNDCIGHIIRSHNNLYEPVEKGSSQSFLGFDPMFTTITTEQFIEYVLNQRVYTPNKPENYDYLIPLIKELDNGN